MAQITITSLEEQEALNKYTDCRNATRDALAFGVYPNCIKTLATYDELDAALNNGLADFEEYHNDTMALVLPHVATIRTAMETIVATVEAIDTAVFGATGSDMFGTYTPPVEEEE